MGDFSGIYVIHGQFSQGNAGDGFSALLVLESEVLDSPAGSLTIQSLVIAGRSLGSWRPVLLSRVALTSAGAVQFLVSKNPPWTFSGFISGTHFSGSHRMDRGPGKPALMGPFSGERDPQVSDFPSLIIP